MKLQLSNSEQTAEIDAEDFEKLKNFKWRLTKSSRNSTQYIVSDYRVGSKVLKKLLHREVLGVSGKVQVDHINRNGLDNRRENLRIASGSQNGANRIKTASRTSEFKGVSWDSQRQKWRVSCGREVVGRYDSETAAAKAYNQAAEKKYGAFAKLNEIRG